MHTKKKLTDVQDSKHVELILIFEEGTRHSTDALIGADSIFGFVRSHVLGTDHPALKPQFAGFWDCRFLVSIEKARELIGQYLKEGEERQYGWVGDGAFFLHDILDNGKLCKASLADS
ncbi:hypothetical protein BU26DRAFT_521657 [Trematosphaeria pertusa]|uniref:FAD-binding domain-containing protein n=1 Tax=Trematosphaeria pertusa TaxID=390896 RepID=A0A6A6I745_9PLEO|nr:uncharacterized protein BU26DRAFT_521657 [Trematosphaeria pertusa]KAF2246191.1 hypothetical protein BU26DRAFT_521657 [Trematosphaeria pertusa]